MNEREFQLEAVKRAPLLEALRDGPKSLGDLDETLGASRSTIHRTLATFEDLNVVRKTDHRYALTGFGRAVSDRTSEFAKGLAMARDLDEFLNAVDADDLEIPTEHFADADVVRAEPRAAHRCVKRIVDLIGETDSLRMFSNVLSPLYVDVARRELIDGMEIEAIFDDRLRYPLQLEYAEVAAEAFRTGRFEVSFTSEVPFELFITDDGMAMAAHDEAAEPCMFVETGDDAAVAWAEARYRQYRDEADRFDPDALMPIQDREDHQPLDERCSFSDR